MSNATSIAPRSSVTLPEAFARGVARLADFLGDARPAQRDAGPALVVRDLRTTRRALTAALAGERPLTPDAPLVARLARALVRAALAPATGISGPNHHAAQAAHRPRLLLAARALGPDVFTLAYRQEEACDAHRFIAGARDTGRRWGRGYHVAPFRSPEGRPMVAAVDARGMLATLAEVTHLQGDGRDPDTGTAIDVAAVFLDPACQANYGAGYLPEGVHVAPWIPWNAPRGATLLAIDGGARLVASVVIPDANDTHAVIAARKDLATVLEVAPTPDHVAALDYEDAAEYQDTDDDFDAGDEWKRGTRYDPRARS